MQEGVQQHPCFRLCVYYYLTDPDHQIDTSLNKCIAECNYRGLQIFQILCQQGRNSIFEVKNFIKKLKSRSPPQSAYFEKYELECTGIPIWVSSQANSNMCF